MPTEINLNRIWSLHESIGSGSFGNVYRVTDVDGNNAALKLIPQENDGSRELVINDVARADGFANVMPIIDSGEHEGAIALVMPLADTSLADYVSAHGPSLEKDEVVRILLDIAIALADLKGAVVHRDLKPQNILRHDGKWHLADFGIARAAEAATAQSTRKFSFTPRYAAPEQWHYEHASEATDVYAFGIIAFELFEGRPPFAGRTSTELRAQHLGQHAPRADSAPLQLRIMIEQCLMKAPGSRPAAGTLLDLLRVNAAQDSPRIGGLLAKAYAHDVQLRAEADVAAERQRLEKARIDRFRSDGMQSFKALPTALFAAVAEEAPGLEPQESMFEREKTVHLLDGSMSIGEATTTDATVGPFRVLATSHISVRQRGGRSEARGRSQSLWFCDAFEHGRFAWYALGFAPGAFASGWPDVLPFSLDPAGAQPAFETAVGTNVQLDDAMIEIDMGDPLAFVQPWIERFALAAQSQLPRISSIPQGRDDRKWRRERSSAGY